MVSIVGNLLHLICVVIFSALTSGMLPKTQNLLNQPTSSRMSYPPKWHKNLMYWKRFDALSYEMQLPMLDEVPTFFGRQSKRGNILNAFSSDTWVTIHRGNTGGGKFQERAELMVAPLLVQNGEYVVVKWRGVHKATANDIIAFYCPVTSKDNEYIDFFTVDVCSTYRHGYGEHSVQLTNLRTNCEFRYFLNISEARQDFVARSSTIMFQGGPEMPLQIHLALTGSPSQMRVMWVSGTDETPIVKFGKDKSLGSLVKGQSQTYKATDFCFQNGVFIDPGFIHDVLLTGLEPSTTYYYTCGIEDHMSKILSFKTAPLIGSDTAYKFIVYGDMGVTDAARTTAKFALKDVIDGCEFVVHNGDISYARGYAYIWDQWHAIIEPYASLVPYMVGIGNHEQNHLDVSKKDLSGVTGNGWHPWWGNYVDDSNGECGVPMYYRFHMPDNGNSLWWYSYDYGLVHFIMISTEHDMGKGSRQYSWLEEDLRNVDRSKTPWIILVGHRPMYTSELATNIIFVAFGMQHLFENLLYKYHVDLALWAHIHSYERTCPVYNQKCVQDGTIHIVVGTGGKEAATEDFDAFAHWSLFHRKRDPYGYGRVTIMNSSTLHWEYLTNSEHQVVDEVWLQKDDLLRQ